MSEGIWKLKFKITTKTAISGNAPSQDSITRKLSVLDTDKSGGVNFEGLLTIITFDYINKYCDK